MFASGYFIYCLCHDLRQTSLFMDFLVNVVFPFRYDFPPMQFFLKKHPSLLYCLSLLIKSSVSRSPLGSCVWFLGNVLDALFPESCLPFLLLHHFHLKREQRQTACLHQLAHILVFFQVYWHAGLFYFFLFYLVLDLNFALLYFVMFI